MSRGSPTEVLIAFGGVVIVPLRLRFPTPDLVLAWKSGGQRVREDNTSVRTWQGEAE
jgi:hypothetical protein